MFTKPCERGGCTGEASAPTENILARRRFCGNRCAAIYRLSQGTQPRWKLTFAHRSAAGKKGGPVTAEKRRREAVRRRALDVRGIVPQSILDQLDERQEALLLTVLARAVELGEQLGAAAVHRRRAYEQARNREAA